MIRPHQISIFENFVTVHTVSLFCSACTGYYAALYGRFFLLSCRHSNIILIAEPFLRVWPLPDRGEEFGTVRGAL